MNRNPSLTNIESRVENIIVTPLDTYPSANGEVLKALEIANEEQFLVREAYFSSVSFGKYKGWKKHNVMTSNIVVPIGSITFFFVDKDREFREITIGRNNYCRITILPGIWMAFTGMDKGSNLLLNLANHLHSPDEFNQAKFNFSDIEGLRQGKQVYLETDR